MILAAGRGERMRPLTDRIPKPLLRVGGKPLIVRLVEHLVGCGIADLVVNVSHLGQSIESALADGKAFGARVTYSRERAALETAGGIAAALPLLGDAPFVTVNGDLYTDFDFGRLAAAADTLSETGRLAHLVLVDNPQHHRGGDFFLEDGMIAPAGSVRLTFSGIGVYHPALFTPVERGAKHQLAALLRPQIARGRVSGEHFKGRWVDVGTPQRLSRLDRLLTEDGGAPPTDEN
ncbi:MAG: nucleotidyltransferase family protein [Betaproteobacteria bacterium]|nr:nucleotidyltransferase family protein [Betaproteobacteria bacterium]